MVLPWLTFALFFLPLYTRMSDADVERVAATVRELLRTTA